MLALQTTKSGSKGNCYVVANGDAVILFDCGVKVKEMDDYLHSYGYSIESIDYIFITHEHSDHINGLSTFKNTRTKIYISEALKGNPEDNNLLKQLDLDSWSNVEHFKEVDKEKGYGERIHLDKHNIWVTPVLAHHNALDPCGFHLINCIGEDIYYTGDTGYGNINIKNCSIYLLEANYSKKHLDKLEEKFGEETHKQHRVKSLKGHNSFEDAIAYADKNKGEKTKHIVYCHLSESGYENVEETFKGREYLPSQKFVARTYQVGVDDTPAWMK